MDDSFSLLTLDFDPASLKLPQLRGVLLENGIEYPSNAKKKELLSIYNNKVKKQKSKSSKRKSKTPSRPEEADEQIIIVDSDDVSRSEEPKEPKPQESRESKPNESEESKESREEPKESKAKESVKPKKERRKSGKRDILDSKETQKSAAGTPSKLVLTSPSDSTRKPPNVSTSPFDSAKKPSNKGNVFDVSSDSDSDLFLAKKHKLQETLPRKDHKKRKTSKEHKDIPKDISKEGPKEGPKEELKEEPQKVPQNVSIPEKTPVSIDTQTDSKASKDEVLLDKKASAPQLPPREESKPENPSIASPSSSDAHSLHVDHVNNTISGGAFGILSHDSVQDNAHSFDSALAKLKNEDISRDHHVLKEEKDAELARLLGLDFKSVKPKQKGKRSITPRRPIVILEKRLSLNPDSFVEDSRSRVFPRDEFLNIALPEKPSLRYSFDTDEEDDTDVEEDHKESGSGDIADDSVAQKSLKSLPPKVRLNIPKRKVAYALQFIGLWIALLGSLLFGYWYREQTFLVGYCGKEMYKPTVPASGDSFGLLVKLGSYLDDNFRPECVACPQHARCFSNLQLGCYEDFVEYKPWYFDLVPMLDPYAKKCVPDSKKAEKVELMIEEALNLLRARNANKNCGRTPIDSFEAGIHVDELHDLLLALKAPYITEEEFEELWERSVVELEKEPEITVRQVAPF